MLPEHLRCIEHVKSIGLHDQNETTQGVGHLGILREMADEEFPGRVPRLLRRQAGNGRLPVAPIVLCLRRSPDVLQIDARDSALWRDDFAHSCGLQCLGFRASESDARRWHQADRRTRPAIVQGRYDVRCPVGCSDSSAPRLAIVPVQAGFPANADDCGCRKGAPGSPAVQLQSQASWLSSSEP